MPDLQGHREEAAFLTGSVKSDSATQLLKKIDKHCVSKMHSHSAEVIVI